MKILAIPDTQVKAGVKTDHLTACGNYIVHKKPDVIIMGGDHYDMPSLSSYTSRKRMEGRRVMADLDAGHAAMALLMAPLEAYNEKMRKHKMKQYKPRLEFLLGNHENRLERHIEDNPQLDGILDYPGSFELEKWGWTVNDFLQPIYIGGFAFAHYFYNPMSGRALGGKAHTKLNQIKTSFCMFHQQGIDIATTTGNDGQQYWGIVAGSFYQHDERYKGPQANEHFRGLVMLHNVKDGDCAPCVIQMDWLLENYLDK